MLRLFRDRYTRGFLLALVDIDTLFETFGLRVFLIVVRTFWGILFELVGRGDVQDLRFGLMAAGRAGLAHIE